MEGWGVVVAFVAVMVAWLMTLVRSDRSRRRAAREIEGMASRIWTMSRQADDASEHFLNDLRSMMAQRDEAQSNLALADEEIALAREEDAQHFTVFLDTLMLLGRAKRDLRIMTIDRDGCRAAFGLARDECARLNEILQKPAVDLPAKVLRTARPASKHRYRTAKQRKARR